MNALDAIRLSHTLPRRGFSLVEGAVATLIVGGMLVVALDTLGGAVHGRQVRADSGRAYALAMDLMSEVLANAYEEPGDAVTVSTAGGGAGGGGGGLLLAVASIATPSGLGPDSGETSDTSRSRFDDVDDYHGWSARPPQARDGTVLTAYDGWTRTVAVAYVNTLTLQSSGSDTRIKRIDVTVTDPSGRATTLSALRSKAGAFDYAPPTTTTYVSHVSMALKSSGARQAVVTGAADLNQIAYGGP
ncbi:MAG: hypothetical protein ACE5E5_12605 [Phycisphaerae bacterium]